MLRYADGTRHELPIQYGRHLKEWWTPAADPTKAAQPLENGIVAWTGSNPPARQQGHILRLYLTTYANPRPDLEVTDIDYVSAMTEAAPFLVAVTIEP